jgi:hypothetical protein
MSASQWLLTAVASLLVASLLGMAWDAKAVSPAAAKLVASVAALTFAVALLLRCGLVRPTFIHANFHAGALLDSVLRFPREASHRSQYGQFGFLTLGALAALFGRSFETVCAANQVFGALTLVALGALARRCVDVRGWMAAATTAAVALLHPGLLRVAASEDAHNLALLLGVVALLAMDVHLVTRQRWALVAATCALVLMVNTRQTLYLFVPLIYLLALCRRRARELLQPTFLASTLVVVAASAYRVGATVGDSGDRVTLEALPVVLSTPSLVGMMLRFHPLLDVGRFGPAGTALVAVGLWRCLRRAGVTRALGLWFLVIFVTTLPFGLPTPGVEFGFRMPAFGLAAVVAGVGGAWIFDAVLRRTTKVSAVWTAAAGALGGIALLPVVTPSWSSVRTVAADFEEYQFIRDVAPSLPRDVVIARLPAQEPMPSYSMTESAVAGAGLHYRIVDVQRLTLADFGRPVLFLAGVQCWGYSLAERAGVDVHSPGAVAELLRRFGPLLLGREPWTSGPIPPPGPRPECAALMERASPVGPRALKHPTQDVPFVIYREDPLPLQFYALAPPP